jgi:hypothetical protein
MYSSWIVWLRKSPHQRETFKRNGTYLHTAPLCPAKVPIQSPVTPSRTMGSLSIASVNSNWHPKRSSIVSRHEKKRKQRKKMVASVTDVKLLVVLLLVKVIMHGYARGISCTYRDTPILTKCDVAHRLSRDKTEVPPRDAYVLDTQWEFDEDLQIRHCLCHYYCCC